MSTTPCTIWLYTDIRMKQIVYVGGVGSTRYTVDIVTRELAKTHTHVKAFSFREAQVNHKQFIKETEGARVITHSAGIVLLDDAKPSEVIAIAPPLLLNPFKLFYQTVKKTYSLILSTKGNRQRKKRLRDYHRQAMIEFVTRPQYIALMLFRIGKFHAIDSSISLANRDIKVTIGLMGNEKLFYLPSQKDLTRAKDAGVEIVSGIPGEHDELLLDPAKVLSYFKQLNS